ncbi:DEAD/DEAH box helicase family protein [Mycobacteroides chelonae]|uniref:Type I restriction endonuclease subunit R n=1 Tax=Mycobacteroides chelonae TaxID=1774 RepID=A0AB73U463_MYCCH|nr:DEAD/DEAH box helicase family protein [Mycobacteroides chelonae]MEC4841099.1 DEAD/DEAH box helicase family protein [Mycobacteroides chelonae]MEC4842769.1 DEAD/DEAH box helicase family protein [Mycobacteroides chelonae]OLT73198.1 restriction endonuclease subunit R [Mycobacteroides chelonae]QDF71819.1 type I restriction endonuclease subunit R [Mycobacteroides chelonae]WED92097.1 DEAD/DEAH box helicase family protein [Mycobacteroides chelonae]
MAQQHHESAFEGEICEYLAERGWHYSDTDGGYDRELALFPDDVFEWLAATQPEQLRKRVEPELTGEALKKARAGVLSTLVKQLGADPKANGGTLSVLRRGFKDLNAQFAMCQFRPNTTLNETTKARYDAVRLRVMRQVHYSTQNSNSIDLVFFVNGIPVATAELKTDLSVQNVTDAVLQYKHHRLPKGEPLLQFGSRALVHFAVSNSEVQMTTKLAGKNTVFLPFNRGNHGHAGNPANPHGGSPTAYLWREILDRDTWLDILGRFLHLQIDEKIDPVNNKKVRTQRMLFPRYHQWDVVTRLVANARRNGPGQRYLVQHSAGSGKTNSISWLAHRLSVLHDDANKPVFDSVIVITDRNVLDAQLQEAIRQIDRTPGVVTHIAGLGGAKSQELAEALTGGTKIIIVTIQTFPYALQLIQEQADLKGKSFAIIADEAHSSQAGEASKRLKAALSSSELEDLDDGGSIDAEDVLAAEMAARAESKNLSFFAFTATPKAKTLELFGHKSSTNAAPHPFHLYSMQQAIEEGFILDVLRNYTPYKTAFRLTHHGQTFQTVDTAASGTVQVSGEPTGDLVDKSAAIKSVMNWVKLHPTNISQKVAIIIEHFRDNVAWRLDGKAKAMVVTSSRKAAAHYKLAFDKYIAEHQYTDIAALVAFSGEVTDPDSGLEKVTEYSMNPGLKGRDLRDAFATDEYQVMLVANKFQTGFDQPLLVAMYVDKRLSGVAAVQTLSRLNRTASSKDQTFVLDFANDADEIVEAFEPYYDTTTLADVTDPNIVHQTVNKLDAAGIYQESEVNGLVADYLKYAHQAGKGHEALNKWLKPAQDVYRDRERQARDHDDSLALEELDLFRKDIGTFLRQYDFLSQIVNYEDAAIEKLSIYLRFLAPTISSEQLHHDIDLSSVDFDYLAQHAGQAADGKLSGGVMLEPAKAGGTGTARDPELVALEQVIAQINDLFSGEHPDSSVHNVVTHIKDRLEESETLQQQAQNNSLAQFSASPDLHSEFVTAVIGAMASSEDLSTQILNNPELSSKLLGELIPVVYEGLKPSA